MKKQIIIVAGGKGIRMNSVIPKQFLVIGNKPVLMHTIERFHLTDPLFNIILVLPADQTDYWNSLCKDYNFDIQHHIVHGGETRFHSVKNGLQKALNDNNGNQSLIGIHDGVRPFVSTDVIDRCFSLCLTHKAVIPTTEVYETIRQTDGSNSHTVDRSLYRLVQTPQVFQSATLAAAYNQPFSPLFTDDASVVEACGETIFLTEGNRENIKITSAFDIVVANALQNQ